MALVHRKTSMQLYLYDIMGKKTVMLIGNVQGLHF